MNADLASTSVNSSAFFTRSVINPVYLSGNFLSMSCATTTASWSANGYPFFTISCIQVAAVFTLDSIFNTIYPIALTAAPTSSISTS